MLGGYDVWPGLKLLNDGSTPIDAFGPALLPNAAVSVDGLENSQSRLDPNWTKVGAGEIPCEGFSSGCQSGGWPNRPAGYRVFNRNVCRDCAVKLYGIENESGPEQQRILSPYLIKVE